MAESPPAMYSKLSAPPGETQPLPVVVATIRYLRSNPPARSRSATARFARSSLESAESRPANARIGSVALVPVYAEISVAVGPVLAKLRPSRPSDSHDTSDPGPPERRGDVVCVTPGLSSPLR